MSQKPTYQPGKFQWSFLLPQYWGIWIGIVFLMILAILPWAIQYRLGQFLGSVAFNNLKSRRKTTIRNLEVCFPEWTSEQVEANARQVFIDQMIGIFETLNAWYSPQWFKNRVQIEGLEHIQNAQAEGKGILLLGTHSTLLDAGGYLCAQFFEPDVVYRPQNNPLLDMLIVRCRGTIYANQIDHDDMRGLIRNLKNGHAIWYSPDQDFGLKQGVMAPFFGTPAATVTAHRRLLKIAKAVAIPLYFYRDGDISNPQYHVLIEPALDNFPSDDDVSDAIRTNKIIENQLRIAPTQYMWFHRRFKTRPQGYDKIY
ncbi:LpxL/LpxP family Kdo(2)-lipid IV(A) lauroyl/palmitoleoyl acyltransferase [Acinetobacter sp. ANC 4945]|uniref:Lipid A biosynthesis acyltransferase n=1 Tax=Acinetobacter amyesii TaxID=2942470 RepID=A0A1T1H3X3_9GAMM|nr:LpxL/LpxP family Kdo(2)-lipid IV(A) lauroyl/palmitoleoyl acyltransferase [Acinetobacter amyesii]MCL6247482.1 LpxL/LpxP family Kdo(2)-lipid IV(A) lauroyl/palmitoleoyl acyltransferase [Acinetobacter amyesii]OOV84554.1 lauroyl acyltransferase [Acinetobacter amyesii]